MKIQGVEFWLGRGCQKSLWLMLASDRVVPSVHFCIMVMEVISRKVSTKNVLENCYADDLAVVVDSKQELHEVLVEWTRKDLYEGHGLRMSLDKTEVLSVGRQRQELGITLGGRDITQKDSFAYLGV